MAQHGTSQNDARRQKSGTAHRDLPSSPGNDPVSQTPKDVAPGEAAAKDVTTRNMASEDLEEKNEAQLDDAIESSFPASDPIAIPSPKKEHHKPQQ